MFVHAVYFWLRDELTEAERQAFIWGVESLKTIEDVHIGHVGVPADTNRPVIDRSYSFSLVLFFEDRNAHDRYQAHPTHHQFSEQCSGLWKKLQIYDSVG